MIKRIISGGQTGADQGGLEAAEILGIERGGVAPRKWLTETGSNPKLLRDRFGLVECLEKGYGPRTKANVLQSDGTALFGRMQSYGTGLTKWLCDQALKPWWWCPWPLFNEETGQHIAKREELIETLRLWIVYAKVLVLNVAGNRESKNPGIQAFVQEFLVEALKEELK